MMMKMTHKSNLKNKIYNKIIQILRISLISQIPNQYPLKSQLKLDLGLLRKKKQKRSIIKKDYLISMKLGLRIIILKEN